MPQEGGLPGLCSGCGISRGRRLSGASPDFATGASLLPLRFLSQDATGFRWREVGTRMAGILLLVEVYNQITPVPSAVHPCRPALAGL